MRLIAPNRPFVSLRSCARVLAVIGIFGFQHHCGSPALRAAEPPVPKPISGTVTDFKTSSLSFAVKTDNGEAASFTVGPQTEVVQVPPGERDLSKAKAAKVTDLSRGDRILVSFVTGLSDARRIVWISATDIAARNEAERLDWQKRGVSGTVVSKDGDQITIETRTPAGAKTTTLAVTDKTVVRRYAPDSVSFTDAQPSGLAKIGKGDQVKSRGTKGEDGKLAAEDIVFGTFMTKMGPIRAIDIEKGSVQIQDVQTQKLLTVKISAHSQFKLLPDMKTMFAAMMTAGGAQHSQAAPSHEGAAPTTEGNFDLAKTIGQLPAGKMEDLKLGSTVIVTSTAGAKADEVTAILLMANADGLIQWARSMSGGGEGMSPTEAVSSLHGGMLGGPSGLNIPAILP